MIHATCCRPPSDPLTLAAMNAMVARAAESFDLITTSTPEAIRALYGLRATLRKLRRPSRGLRRHVRRAKAAKRRAS